MTSPKRIKYSTEHSAALELCVKYPTLGELVLAATHQAHETATCIRDQAESVASMLGIPEGYVLDALDVAAATYRHECDYGAGHTNRPHV